jgi:sirohydrochlorin cobaltochelatase
MNAYEHAAQRDPLGLLIVGHGTRDDRGSSEFAELVRAVRAIARETLVEGCFLELVEPDIATAVRSAFDRGARTLVVVPLLLVEAGHAKRDIPDALAAAQARLPGLTIHQTPHLGSHRAILQLAHRRYVEALEMHAAVPPEDTLLLVVGRGTKDAMANAELCHFARRRWEQTHVGGLETCFLAMTEPSLDRALAMVTQLPFSRIAVEPHFLFEGELLDRVRDMVAQAAERWPTREFVIAERLGPDEMLAQAVLELARACHARH